VRLLSKTWRQAPHSDLSTPDCARARHRPPPIRRWSNDFLQVPIPLCRNGRGGSARDRGRTRWHDNGGIRVTLSESLAHPVLNRTVTFPVLNLGQPGADRPSLATSADPRNTSYA
jgi:hypothetical protein